MIAHLGKNPVSGGSPPVDRRISEILGTSSHVDSCVYNNDWIENDPFTRNTDSRMIAIGTSYEII